MVTARRRILLTAFALVILGNSGCAALIVGGAVAGGAAAGYAYYNGSVPRDYPAGFEQTWAATHSALRDLGYPILGAEMTRKGGKIESQTADGQHIGIIMEPSPQQDYPGVVATRVYIRVTTFGDHPQSERILQQIQTRLSGGAVPPAPPAPPNAPTLQRQIPIPQQAPAGEPIPVTTKGNVPPKWTAPGSNPRPSTNTNTTTSTSGEIPVTVRDAQPMRPPPRPPAIQQTTYIPGEPPLAVPNR